MIRAAFLFLGSFVFFTALLPLESFAIVNDGIVAASTPSSPLPELTSARDILVATTKKKKWRQCPVGENRDPSTGVCFSCSHNDHFENGVCVPCRAGFHEEGDECVADVKKSKKAKSCPQGTEFKNGKCRKTEFPEIEQCPEGQQPDLNTGVCFSCSHNDHFENGVCVPCKEGFHVEGDQCVAD